MEIKNVLGSTLFPLEPIGGKKGGKGEIMGIGSGITKIHRMKHKIISKHRYEVIEVVSVNINVFIAPGHEGKTP